jgi:predicted nucleotidyltransferase
MRDPNLDQLIGAADALRPLLAELVFVGGCVTGLLITDEAAGEPRATIDVDAIAEITSYAQYAEFGDRLRSRGFSEDTSEGAPVCRWVQGRMILDVMPLDEKILGFSNRWYKAAMGASVTKKLRDDLEIRMVTAPYFVATKLEAFKGRGGGDFLGSHDLEDVVSVVDGRGTLSAEVQVAGAELSEYVRREIAKLLANPGFIDALPGLLLPDTASQLRIGIVLARLRNLASI